MKFEFFQVEITRKCPMNCIMCPSKLWKSGAEMKFEVFEEASKYFKYAKIVHLQGWGEPLTHSRFFDMLEIVKESSMVGFTTNGMLLNEKGIKRIAEIGVDYIAVSIAGIGETHDRIRKGTNFSKILENVKRLVALKEPKVILTFLMNKLNIEELPRIVELAASVGVDEVVATNLDYVFDEVTDDLKIFSCKKPDKKYVKVLKQSKKVAKKLEVKLRTHPLQLEDVLICDALPTKSVTISAEGNLYPCIYLCLPFQRIPRIFCGKYIEVEKPNFGNVYDFWNSWNSKNYVEFREKYEKRLKEYEKLFRDAFLSPYNIVGKIKNVLEKNPVPKICETCYKAYGI